MTESSDDVWHDDLLGRSEDAKFLETFLVNRMAERNTAGLKGSYVLNLDAGWGYGKSFFMRRFKKQLENAGHPVVIIDAWKNDFSDDPYTNVISEIEGYFQSHLDNQKKNHPALSKAYDAMKKNAAKIAWIAFKGAAKKASRYVIDDAGEQIKEVIDQHVVTTGDAGKEIAEATEAHFVEVTDGIIDAFAKKRLEEFNAAKISLESFRSSLGTLLHVFEKNAGKKLPMFVLIDELDRCRPTYAIAMLERIKHLFDADNVVFVLATDTDQLSHSIGAVYGSTFDSRRYLQRFFMRTYELPTPGLRQLIESLVADYAPVTERWAVPSNNQDYLRYLSEASSNYKMSLRETKQAFDILASLTTTWPHTFPIQLGVMFPLVLGHLRREDISSITTKETWFQQLIVSATGWSLPTGRKHHTVRQMVLGLVSRLSKPMTETLDQFYNQPITVSEFPDEQAYDILRTEYALRKSEYNIASATSMILRYPEMIRHAGRLIA